MQHLCDNASLLAIGDVDDDDDYLFGSSAADFPPSLPLRSVLAHGEVLDSLVELDAFANASASSCVER